MKNKISEYDLYTTCNFVLLGTSEDPKTYLLSIYLFVEKRKYCVIEKNKFLSGNNVLFLMND